MDRVIGIDRNPRFLGVKAACLDDDFVMIAVHVDIEIGDFAAIENEDLIAARLLPWGVLHRCLLCRSARAAIRHSAQRLA
jgi:hypothetical protein